MGKRIKLGLIFTFNENWIGGTYYLINLVSALKCLPTQKQPKIFILSNNISDFHIIKKIGYYHVEYFNPYNYGNNILYKNLEKYIDYIFDKKIFKKILLNFKIDVLFPANNESCYDLIKNKIYWIPDFQHIYFPDYFSKSEIIRRESILKKIASVDKKLVLSSYSSKNDWDLIDCEKKCTIHVIPFAVSLPNISAFQIEDLRIEFSISKQYFIVSNQFWKHKNHLVVLKAALELKYSGFNIQFVFTGKFDFSDIGSSYSEVNDFINSYQLHDNFRILGLIDRVKQLVLMENSIAVIQPSLFEGWSTVIEDAKSLNKNVIASDIPIHREQIKDNVLFFSPNNHCELVKNCIKLFNTNNIVVKKDYDKNILSFANQFYHIL